MQRLKAISEYEGWMRLTSTQQITIKGGQVAEAAITEAYVARFNKELENLKAKKVKVKLVKRSEEHTSELQSLMRLSYAVFCLNKKIKANKCRYKHIVWIKKTVKIRSQQR